MIKPPKGVEPGRLFRLLLQRPRPVAPLAYRIRGAEAIPLRVRALSSLDEGLIADAAEGPEELGGSTAMGELVHRALLAPGGPAFASPDEVGALGADEVYDLAKAVRAALDTISPTYLRHDAQTWDVTLQKGAKTGANWAEALSLGGCVDYALGMSSGRCVERPDRYFGCPLADLTDGQWMVYRAARTVAEELRKK